MLTRITIIRLFLSLTAAVLCAFATGCGESEAERVAHFNGFWEIRYTNNKGDEVHLIREHSFSGPLFVKTVWLTGGSTSQKGYMFFLKDWKLVLEKKILTLEDAGGPYQVMELRDDGTMRISYPRATSPLTYDAKRIEAPAGGIYVGKKPLFETLAEEWTSDEYGPARFRFSMAEGTVQFTGRMEPIHAFGTEPRSIRNIVATDDDLVLIAFLEETEEENPVLIIYSNDEYETINILYDTKSRGSINLGSFEPAPSR